MKWKAMNYPARDEKIWYVWFAWYPVKIEGYWHWLTFVEERYTGRLTAREGEKIYEHRIIQEEEERKIREDHQEATYVSCVVCGEPDNGSGCENHHQADHARK